jgi:hypothetical protein
MTEEKQETLDRSIVCPKSPGWWYGSSTGIHALGCKSRQCEVCQKYWSTRWRIALNFKCDYDAWNGIEDAGLTLTLTFAEPCGHEVARAACRYFFQFLHEDYPKVKYFKSVEFNQKHTQPHLHFILQFAEFIPYKQIRIWWLKAQKWAGIGLKAWNIRIEEIKKNMAAYLSKYLTKAGKEAKDEIPRRDLWRGRYVSYSPGFFPRPLPDMLKMAQFHRQMETHDAIDRVFIYIDKTDKWLEPFTLQAQTEWAAQVEEINYEWDYKKDNLYGVKVTLDLFDISEYNSLYAQNEWPQLST